MKLNPKLAFLALALAGGMASAAVPRAGSSLTNVATADFTVTDPTTNATTNGSSASNQVTTLITPLPSFTITPNTGDAALTHDGANAVNAGSNSAFTYTVTNTGNTPLTINLTNTAGNDNAPTGVTLDKTTVTLDPNASTTVTQTYTIPNTATGGTYYGENLTGTALYDSTPSADGTGDSYTETYTGNTDVDNVNRTQVFTVAKITPGSPGTGTTPVPTDSTNPQITPTDPSNPNGPGTTNTGYTQPDGPTVPGGPTLPGTGTPVVVAPDGSQTAYPKADPETGTPDQVTMTGTVPNNSGKTDNLTVGPATIPAGSPSGTTAQIINPATGQPFQNGEVPKDINGNPINGATVTVNPDGSVTFNNVPSGTAPAYSIQVTYPDTDGANAPTAPISVNVPITSSNAGGQQVSNPVYTVKPPHVIFGNTDGLNNNTVSTTPANNQVTPSTTGDVTTVFPMNVVNDGEYNESYTISGTTSVPNGKVTYYTDTNGNGTYDPGTDQAVTTVGPVAANTELSPLVFAVVTVPANTAAGSYTVSQNIKGTYSGISRDFNTDTVQVGVVENPNPTNNQNPLFPIDKHVDKTSAAPGDNLVYTINATNKYNVATCSTILKEIDGSNTNIFANSTYQSITGTASTGTVLFSTNQGSSWGAAPAAGALTSLWAGVDTNGDGTINGTDCLPSGGTINLTMTTKVNGGK